jgi:hypothetical protein
MAKASVCRKGWVPARDAEVVFRRGGGRYRRGQAADWAEASSGWLPSGEVDRDYGCPCGVSATTANLTPSTRNTALTVS